MAGTMSSKPENQPGKTSASHCRNRTRNLVKKDYTLTVNRYAGIAAPTGQGVFWGTRTLLQILHNEQGKLPKGRHGIIRFSQT
ncbi:MAG: glycoside hydrolase family 20 zincin-like fold domain-containing protein [Bacteroides xylanisolvens]